MTRLSQQLAAVLLAAALPWQAGAGLQHWDFTVYLDDKPIGTHSFSVQPQGEQQLVAISAQFTVRFLFFTAYTYTHQSQEIWQGPCLAAIQASTDDNGKQLQVSGARRGAVLDLQTPEGAKPLAGCVQSFAYWDPRILDASHLLNAQTGEYQPVEIEALGSEVISVREQAQHAQRFRLTVDGLSLDLWYSAQQEWLGLESTTRSGRRLRYQLN